MKTWARWLLALDHFTAHLKIWKLVDGSFYAVKKYDGIFAAPQGTMDRELEHAHKTNHRLVLQLEAMWQYLTEHLHLVQIPLVETSEYSTDGVIITA